MGNTNRQLHRPTCVMTPAQVSNSGARSFKDAFLFGQTIFLVGNIAQCFCCVRCYTVQWLSQLVDIISQVQKSALTHFRIEALRFLLRKRISVLVEELCYLMKKHCHACILHTYCQLLETTVVQVLSRESLRPALAETFIIIQIATSQEIVFQANRKE